MRFRPAVIPFVAAVVLATVSWAQFGREVRGTETTPVAKPTPATRPRTVSSSGRQPDLRPGASLHGKQLFPPDNPWNQDISNAPADPNSDRIIAAISDLGLLKNIKGFKLEVVRMDRIVTK